MWIREATVFGESFAVVATLVVVESARISAVVAGEDFTLVVESYTESVPTTFSEDFVLASLRVVPPDGLSEALYWLFGGSVGAYCSADRGALSAVEPSIGAECEAIDDRVGIFESESFEVNLWRCICAKIVVGIFVVEEVRRV
jgi:hypothetical protein